jgi:hypothetical protein
MTANVDDQRGKGTIAPRQVCGQKLDLMGTSSPQPQRHGSPNLALFPHALGRHPIPPAKRLDQSQSYYHGWHIGPMDHDYKAFRPMLEGIAQWRSGGNLRCSR